MYDRNHYVEIVSVAAESSMQSAVEEVKALPDYSTKGEVCIIMLLNDVLLFSFSG